MTTRVVAQGTVYRTGTNAWAVLDNATHVSDHIASVTGDSLCVIVHFDFTAVRAVHAHAQGDEAYAMSDIIIGPSLQLGAVVLTLARNKVRIDPNAITADPTVNIWVRCELEVAD